MFWSFETYTYIWLDWSSVTTHMFFFISHLDKICPICLDEFTNPKHTKCGHQFCSGCLKEALKHDPFCPTCKHPLRTIIGKQPQGGQMTHRVCPDTDYICQKSLCHSWIQCMVGVMLVYGELDCFLQHNIFALHCTIHSCRYCTDSHCLAMRDTIPYKLTTGSHMEFRAQNILTLADDSLALQELPTFLIHTKEGKSCRYEWIVLE